jgi:hypothetical protein
LSPPREAQGRIGDRHLLGRYLQMPKFKGGKIARQTVVRAWDG